MKKKRLPFILSALALFAGLSLLLYPSVSKFWNSMHQTAAIAGYVEAVTDMKENDLSHQLEEAREYNAGISLRKNLFLLSEEEAAEYNSLLDVSGTGIMGYVEIPSISTSLPVYHGTDEAVLQVGAGHLEWSSLPVGGLGTHSVISGHRGLPSARCFTDLDKMEVGDVFMLQVLGEVLTYEVDQILTVLPTDTNALKPVMGKDYCTLVTCTPYGINTHRLLLRGHRVDSAVSTTVARVPADGTQVEEMIVAAVVGVPMLLLILVVVMVWPVRKTDDSDLL